MTSPATAELDATNRAMFEATLAQSHQVRTRVDIYDANEARVDPLDYDIVGGQVDVDATADISRTLSLTIADPLGKFRFAPGGSLWIDQMLKVYYGVLVDAANTWIDVPVFFGPVSLYARNNAEVSIEAQGKEALWLPPRTQTRAPGPTMTSVAAFVRSVAASYGESRFAGFTSFGAKRIPKDFNMDVTLDKDESREDKNRRPTYKAQQPGSWGLIQKLGRGVDFQIYYNGKGELAARPTPGVGDVVYTFRSGEGGIILTEPGVSIDLSNIANVVVIESKDPNRNATKPVRFAWPLDEGHALSKQSLTWNGKPREYIHTETYGHQLTPADAKKRAVKLLTKLTQATQDVDFECLPVPHIEPGDMVRVETEAIQDNFEALTYTIPLGAGDSMSFGFTKQVPTGQVVLGRRQKKGRR